MNFVFSRREALKAAALFPLVTNRNLVQAISELPSDLPEGVRAVINNTLALDPGSLNTDWFGTVLLQGLLEWHRRGVTEVREFAAAWLDHHLREGKVSRFSGSKGREVVAGGIHITTYTGHFGLAFPCYEMAVQFQDPKARQVCIEVGKIVLHQTARNRLGMVEHDDGGEFAIPDTCYFAVRALMSASSLDREWAQVFREQAIFQLRTYVDTFLDEETGLAKTVLYRDGLGKTYWTRASGWLLWAITAVLRLLPQTDPSFPGFREDLRKLVEGMVKVQDPSGGFRVLLDDPQTPLETTGTAMFADGVHEAMRKQWLPASYREAVDRAWGFVKSNVTKDGQVVNAYTGWALPAENREMSMDEYKMGWIPGFILIVANEMTTP
jgi:rhamnogalacturonyl hydrolase YesR